VDILGKRNDYGGMMANFAKVTNNQVDAVIVVSNDSCNDLPFPESEPVGQAFIASIGLNGTWLQTSYNNNFRGTYAGTGYTFDPSLGEYGEFVAPPVPPIEQ
jgi:hypothetical protein